MPTTCTTKGQTDDFVFYIGYKGRTSRSDLHTSGSLLQAKMDTSVSSDLIGALLQRGEKLREAMVVSADEDNDLDDPTGLASVVERSVV